MGSDIIKFVAGLGEENRAVFSHAKRQGIRCQDTAAWIRLER